MVLQSIYLISILLIILYTFNGQRLYEVFASDKQPYLNSKNEIRFMPVKSEMDMINKKDITEIDWSVIIPLMPTVTNTTNGLYPASNFKNLPKIIGITDSTVLIKIATLTKSYEYIRLKVIDVSSGLIGEVNISVSTDAYGALSQITKKVLYGNLKFYINRNDGSIYVEKGVVL